jgi:hypothetical protein
MDKEQEVYGEKERPLCVQWLVPSKSTDPNNQYASSGSQSGVQLLSRAHFDAGQTLGDKRELCRSIACPACVGPNYTAEKERKGDHMVNANKSDFRRLERCHKVLAGCDGRQRRIQVPGHSLMKFAATVPLRI